MDVQAYFEHTKGMGVLATSDSDGNVDLAIYGRPHVIDENTIAFIMRERLSFANLKSNPKAAYMFVEKTEGYCGKRFYLTKIDQQSDPEIIGQFRRGHHGSSSKEDAPKAHLVTFSIDRIRPLVGDVKE
jgi:hypothetical protein